MENSPWSRHVLFLSLGWSQAKLLKGLMIKITWTQFTMISKFKSCQLSQVTLLCSAGHVKTQTAQWDLTLLFAENLKILK